MHTCGFDFGVRDMRFFEDQFDGEDLEVVLLAERRLCRGAELMDHFTEIEGS
jgi:hypothetical protein